MQSIEISNPGVKITVEGQVVKKNRSLTEKVENSRASEKVKTVEMRSLKVQSNNNDKKMRLKTDSRVEGSVKSNREGPSTIRPSREKMRIET